MHSETASPIPTTFRTAPSVLGSASERALELRFLSSSARATTVGRNLIANSNLVGCSTGISAGFVPRLVRGYPGRDRQGYFNNMDKRELIQIGSPFYPNPRKRGSAAGTPACERGPSSSESRCQPPSWPAPTR
jgi:hypothetical protein